MFLTRGLLVAAFIVIAATTALPDTVDLKNGDRITGTISGIKDGKLLFQTEAMGEVPVDLGAIAALHCEENLSIVLPDGTRYSGTMEAAETGEIKLVGTTGEVTAPLTDLQLLIVTPPDGLEAYFAELEKQKPSPWSGKLGLGFTWSTGNSERLGFNFLARGVRKTDVDKFLAELAILYAEQEDEVVQNQQYLKFRYDRNFAKDWYAYGLLQFEHDELQDLELRGILAAGVGWTFVNTPPKLTMSVDAAPSLTYQQYEGESSEWIGELRLGYHLDWAVFEKATVTWDFTLIPNLTDTGEYRIDSVASFEQPISDVIAFRLSWLYRYNSIPPTGVKETDNTLLASVDFSF
jgi:putative salt-induced outer membrane protein YdiY